MNKDFMREINRIANEILKTPSYRYYKDSKRNQYFWTTTPLYKNGRKRFASGIYRYLKTKKQWVLRKKVYHAKRYKAKERAWKLYQKAN